ALQVQIESITCDGHKALLAVRRVCPKIGYMLETSTNELKKDFKEWNIDLRNVPLTPSVSPTSIHHILI
ncbi:MAG TPA: hypothetical protein PLJ08_23045, partial [Cyclobacteriaceae bacterium]|nr:hypothetical protein [Cyclobacteriaceae bacterium]